MAAPAVELAMRPVGRVHGGRTDRDDTDHWGDVTCEVVVDPTRFGAPALSGLGDFSHVEVVFVFDQTSERADYTVTRPGRGRPDLPAVGVFAERGPRRPNRIGTTMCEILAVAGNRLTVRGLDALDGTLVLDLKPVLRQFLPTAVRQPEWVDDLMSQYHAPGGSRHHPSACTSRKSIGSRSDPMRDDARRIAPHRSRSFLDPVTICRTARAESIKLRLTSSAVQL